MLEERPTLSARLTDATSGAIKAFDERRLVGIVRAFAIVAGISLLWSAIPLLALASIGAMTFASLVEAARLIVSLYMIHTFIMALGISVFILGLGGPVFSISRLISALASMAAISALMENSMYGAISDNGLVFLFHLALLYIVYLLFDVMVVIQISAYAIYDRPKVDRVTAPYFPRNFYGIFFFPDSEFATLRAEGPNADQTARGSWRAYLGGILGFHRPDPDKPSSMPLDGASKDLSAAEASKDEAPGIEDPRIRFCGNFAVNYSDILAISGEENYVRFTLTTGEKLVRMPLHKALTLLEGMDGLAVHRSHWVSTSHDCELIKANGRNHVVLSNGKNIPVARRLRVAVEQALAR